MENEFTTRKKFSKTLLSAIILSIFFPCLWDAFLGKKVSSYCIVYKNWINDI